MNRFEIVKIINEGVLDDNVKHVIEYLNTTLARENYQNELDLIYMAIATTQLYGFLCYLKDSEIELFYDCDYFRSNSYRGIELPYYNRGQLSFLYDLDIYQKVFFSAPTSFGKTSIVAEYILNNSESLNNIAFIVPTNSLLEELYEKYTTYNLKLNLKYNITTQPINLTLKRNIMFLTPERFMTLIENFDINNFDLIVMDETYKIVDAYNKSVSDFVNRRSLRFRKVADVIAKSKSKVIFLSPFTYELTNSMNNFLNKYNIKKIDCKFEYVKREIIKMNSSKDAKNHFGIRNDGYGCNLNVVQKTKFILNNLKTQKTIVYVTNYSKAYEIAAESDFDYSNIKFDSRHIAFLEHIKKNFLIDGKENWAVYDALKKGVGIYIAPLPRYIKKEIVHLYEKSSLNTLIVTTAFTEGVNTCASNLIFTSLSSGSNKNKLSDIDVLNVSGRAGRFGRSTIGRVFCINDKIYNHVVALQNSNNIKLENLNYINNSNLIDYEMEMMDDEYLNEKQKEQLQNLQSEIENLGLSTKELNISLNVSNKWKIILYKHFSSLNIEKHREINDKIKSIFEQKEGEHVSALDFIFKDIKKAFDNENINAFPHEPYEISPFDKSGEFVWGRLYKMYVSGSPKIIVSKNIQFITSEFLNITKGINYSNKKMCESIFEQHGAKWILKYYNDDLTIDMNAFYSETFKFISNIIQYKIPFYLVFYISIFKLFVEKNKQVDLGKAEFDINKLFNIFEDRDVKDEYSKLIDYGLPITTINKISDSGISFDDLKSKKYDDGIFDDYEKIILDEIIVFL